MKPLKRKEFLQKAALLATAGLLLPRFGYSRTPGRLPAGLTPKRAATAANLIQASAIVDLHCHPSLKAYLLGKKFWKRHLLTNPGANIFHMQEDAHQFSTGNVRGIVATHYLAEGGIEKQWGTIRWLWPVIKLLFFPLSDRVEHEDYSNFTQINIMIDTVESQLHVANEKLTQLRLANPGRSYINFAIARDIHEFERALKRPNTIPIAHAIEGAHALGRNFPISKKRKSDPKYKKYSMTGSADSSDPSLYLRNLRALSERGVCMMTLGHFFENDIVFPVDGISEDSKKLPGMTWSYDPANDDKPLKQPVGAAVVRQMLTDGMIVDITHTTPRSRQDVFAISREVNAERAGQGKHPRPVIFSHVGAQHIFEKYDQLKKYNHYKYYDASDEEIDSICEFDGLIGIIPENFWLVGADTNLKKDGFDPARFRLGIPYILETMKYVNSKTRKKNFENIGIGTDFDGLADNPKDLYLNSQVSDLIKAMEADPEINQGDQIAAITSGNALRILRRGWGEAGI